MGLSDIDEDEPIIIAQAPPVVRSSGVPNANAHQQQQPPAAAPARQGGGMDFMDELFSGNAQQPAAGNNNNSSNNNSNNNNTSSNNVTVSRPADDILDALFTATNSSAANAGGGGSKAAGAGEDGAQVIFVDRRTADADDGDNLLDLAGPVERQTYNDASSFLDAFERQGKRRGGGGGNATESLDSLQHLTRNKDNNKVRARLLALMNYYDVLGVAPGASVEEIKRSYKKKALELHPDRVGRSQTADEAELFKEITKANEVLTDPDKRQAYDESLAQEAAGSAATEAQHGWWAHVSAPNAE